MPSASAPAGGADQQTPGPDAPPESPDDKRPGPPKGSKSKKLIILLVLALIAVVAAGAYFGRGRVENTLEGDTRDALADRRFSNVDIKFEGREGTITGFVNSADDRAVLRAIVDGTAHDALVAAVALQGETTDLLGQLGLIDTGSADAVEQVTLLLDELDVLDDETIVLLGQLSQLEYEGAENPAELIELFDRLDFARSVDTSTITLAVQPDRPDGPQLTVEVSAETVTLSGTFESDEEIAQVRTDTAAATGKAAVDGDTLVKGAVGEAPWVSTVPEAVQVLTGVSDGVLRFDNAGVRIEGTVVDEATKTLTVALLAAAVAPLPVDDELLTVAEFNSLKSVLARINNEIVLFEPGSAAINPDAQPLIEELAAALLQQPGSKLQIIGHTDDRGSEEYNQTLSERRAGALRLALVALDVPRGQVTAVGKGETEPIAENETAEGRAENRRIEFVVQ